MNHGPQFGKHCSDNEEKKKNHQTGFQRLSSGSDNPSLLKLQGLLVIVKYEERAESFLRFLPALWYFFFNPLDWKVFPFHHTSSHYSSLVITILSFNSLQRISFSSLLVFQVPQPPPAPSYLLSLSEKPHPHPQVSALTEHHPPWHPRHATTNYTALPAFNIFCWKYCPNTLEGFLKDRIPLLKSPSTCLYN